MELSLDDPDMQYFVGLLQTDGHHAGNPDGKGRVSLELSGRDSLILRQLSDRLPVHTKIIERTRASNFSESHASCILHIYSMTFRRFLADSGVPAGKKSSIVKPPAECVNSADYWRGVIDGDGSVGWTARGIPFISLVSASEPLAVAYSDFIRHVTGKQRKPGRNSRDNVFNVMVTNITAATLARAMYLEGRGSALSIERKRLSAAELSAWVPPHSRFGVIRSAWSEDQDQVVLSVPVGEAAKILNRTPKSVSVRKSRLAKRLV